MIEIRHALKELDGIGQQNEASAEALSRTTAEPSAQAASRGAPKACCT